MFKYFVVSIILISSLFAHPHTFIDLFPVVNSKNNEVSKIKMKWRFDEMTSQLLIMEFDQNLDGKLDKNEIAYVKENYFDNLENYNYYTDIKLFNKAIKTKPINFTASIEDGMFITYNFEVAINTPKENFQISFYDEEMFTAFMLKKDFVKSDIGFKVVDVDNDYYFAYRLQFN